MSKRLDLTGKRFERLLVMGRAADYISPKGEVQIRWKCKCDCGAEVIVRRCHLTAGLIKSCGCFARDYNSVTKRTHGMSNSRVFAIWKGITKRCCNLKSTRYRYYGAKGVTVCDRWRISFVNFFEDMGYPPTNKHSIDRIDPKGNYCKANCRWATQSQQMRNQNRNVLLTVDGETKCVTEWANLKGFKRPQVIFSRLRNGWSAEEAVMAPVIWKH